MDDAEILRLDNSEILRLYDEQQRRGAGPPGPGWVAEDLGRVVRTTPPPEITWGGFVEWSNLDETNADDAIADSLAYYGAIGRRFEWKYYAHDHPADLPERLVRHGFRPEERESLLVAETETVLATAAQTPPGVVLRHLDDDADFAALGELNAVVWGRGEELPADLAREYADDPAALRIHLAAAEPDGRVVSVAWIRFTEGSDFAGLWGGMTHPDWRGRGLYRALVHRRAVEAAERGVRFLQVDATEDSRPILQRLGFRLLTTTTPYVWEPSATGAPHV